MKNLYSNMHNLVQLSKTLRFELKPIGKTKEFFEKNILESDEQKAAAYPFVKKYCDEVHKQFISDCLKIVNKSLLEKELEEYINIVSQKEIDNDALDKVKKNMRVIISESFTKNKKYKDILGEKMLSCFVREKYQDDELAMKQIEQFDKFSTYFVGYHETRNNMYKNEEKHTSIAYRLIDENLNTFKNNIKLFAKFAQYCPDKVQKIKDELNIDMFEFFTDIKQYSNCLTQEDIEKYNLAISGKSLEDGQKIQGVNEYINLFNQQNKDKSKLIKFKVLYKQILSDTNNASFAFDVIENDKQVVNEINVIYETFRNIIEKEEFVETFKNISEFDFEKIYINNDSLTNFSNQLYGDWNYITKMLENDYDKNYKGKTKSRTEKYNENREKEIKKIKNISLKFIEDNAEEKGKIAEYFSKEIDSIISKIKTAYSNCADILLKEYNETEKVLQNDKTTVEKIKTLLDSLKNLQNFVKTIIPKSEEEVDLSFYNALNYENLTEIIPVYNKVRNYMTKKPYSEEKIKLNFNCPTLLNGWDLNKEEANLSILFEKDGLYYLGLMNKADNKVFRNAITNDKDYYRKIEYKILAGPNKMLPKVFFSKSRIKEFAPSDELLTKYEKGLHKKEANNIEFCHELIDFFKKSISKHEDWKNFNFKFSETSAYTDISKFYREVTEQGYKISYQNISSDYINNLVEEGKLYLFQIYNKDFSKHSKGTPNLHTMYWKALFDEENLKNVVYKLNGEAEVFYRKKSITSNIVIHKANAPIENKNPLNEKKTSTFEYELVKDRRYTVDKFLFHVPITLNFKAIGITKFNDYTNTQIRNAEDIHIIGIDRGERNLLYISVIDSNGNIKEQYSLNEIVNEYKGQTYKTDYHLLLQKKENERDKARKSWGTIENIKELKEGYMSQVVHKLVELMQKYNAIIVLEDLNKGMKNSRKKVEKQIYGKFETMLINKLSYVVDKNIADKNEEGGLLNAYQFATSSNKDSKQNGFVFYIPAWNTSKIDPTTGFVNLFNLKDYSSEEKCKNFVEIIKDIRFENDYFAFDIYYPDFSERDCGCKKDWTLCSYGERIRTFRDSTQNNSWQNETINLTTEFKKLFEKYGINLNNIKSEILTKADSKFFKSEGKDGYFGFMYLFKLMLQMRNSKTGSTDSKDDYIISPVKNAKGIFYDSRKDDDKLPIDADANGAYNIARKGLMLLNRIKETTEDNPRFDYKISNVDWLNYVQENDK